MKFKCLLILPLLVASLQAASVSILSPLDGDSVTAGHNVEILMNANNPDGFITQVSVYEGNTLLGQAYSTGNANDYQYILLTDISNVGVLGLEARATDELGNVVSSGVVNLYVHPGNAPAVSIDSPSNGFTARVGIPFQIRLSAVDTDGIIASVRLRDVNFDMQADTIQTQNGSTIITHGAVIESTRSFNENLMQESSTYGEYVFTANLIDQDIVDLVAVALDNSGNEGNSYPVRFIVAPGIAPQVTITSPLNGYFYNLSDIVTILIDAEDSDGSVTAVEVFNGPFLLGTATRISDTNFQFNYTTNLVGSINLQARVMDDSGHSSVSNIETINVSTGAMPEVVITSPTDGDSIKAGSNVSILLTAADADGLITQVNIFDGNTFLGQAEPTGVAGQYQYDFSTNIEDAGIIKIQARATDERGNEVFSNSVVHLTVYPHIPGETLDSDGDGIVDSDDAFPYLPTQDVVNAIKSNPTTYNIYSIDDIKDLRAGSTMIEVENGTATLSMEVEQSDDLEIWTNGGASTLQIPIDAEAGKKFFRFKMTE